MQEADARITELEDQVQERDGEIERLTETIEVYRAGDKIVGKQIAGMSQEISELRTCMHEIKGDPSCLGWVDSKIRAVLASSVLRL